MQSSIGRTCPGCGVNNKMSANWCDQCGATLYGPGLSKPVTPAATPEKKFSIIRKDGVSSTPIFLVIILTILVWATYHHDWTVLVLKHQEVAEENFRGEYDDFESKTYVNDIHGIEYFETSERNYYTSSEHNYDSYSQIYAESNQLYDDEFSQNKIPKNVAKFALEVQLFLAIVLVGICVSNNLEARKRKEVIKMLSVTIFSLSLMIMMLFTIVVNPIENLPEKEDPVLGETEEGTNIEVDNSTMPTCKITQSTFFQFGSAKISECEGWGYGDQITVVHNPSTAFAESIGVMGISVLLFYSQKNRKF